MRAYVIVETDVQDAEQYERYKGASPAAVASGGGRFVARGGELAVRSLRSADESLEPVPVTASFPNLEAVRRWYDSPEYVGVRKLREGAAHLRMVAVEGV